MDSLTVGFLLLSLKMEPPLILSVLLIDHINVNDETGSLIPNQRAITAGLVEQGAVSAVEQLCDIIVGLSVCLISVYSQQVRAVSVNYPDGNIPSLSSFNEL